MKGGYQILDLRNIGLELKNSAQNITDAKILDQLRGLRSYIEKGHDYTKPLNSSLKAIMIRYRDAKNDEKLEECQFADIISYNSSLSFSIKTKELNIIVVFEEKTNDDGVKYYDIKTAQYTYSKNESIEGNLNIGNKLDVGSEANFDDDVTIGNKLTVNGYAEFKGAVVDMHQADVQVFTSADEGKFVNIDGDGNLQAVNAPSGSGTQLYKHTIALSTGEVIAFNNSSTQITGVYGVQDIISNGIGCKFKYQGKAYIILSFVAGGGGAPSTLTYLDESSQTLKSSLTVSFTSDTVTEL